MLTKLFDFIDPTLYIFDSNLIDFTVSQKPRLKLQDNPGQDFVENFDSDIGFNYDPTKAEFVGGKLQQKDQRPAGSTFGANYGSSVNANYADGDPNGTAYNGAAVVSGKLDLSGLANKYIDYDANLNADMQQVGCLRFKWTPKYSGAGNFQYLITIVDGPGLANNRLRLYHQSTLLFLNISDSAGGSIISTAEAFSPIADTEYEIEVNWDLTNGETRLFVDGIQLGITHPGTGTRDANIGLVRLGKDLNLNGNANFLIDDLIFFNAVQHTSNYVPGYSVIDYIYSANNIILPEMEYTGAGTLVSFDAFATVEGGSPRYTLQVGRSGDYLYWDGAAWSVSDGTYSQANDAATFNSNVGDLDIEGEIYGQFKIHFTDSNTISDIDTLTASLTAQIYPLTNPSIVFTETIDTESLSAFSETATKTGNDEIKYILSKNNVQYYWDGSAWITSDGTYAQSNTAAEIEANKTTFTTEGVELAIKMLLHSDTGVTTPEVTLVSVSYDFWGGNIDAPHKTIVFGVCYGEDGNLLPDVDIAIILSKKEVTYNTEIILFDIPTIEVTSDPNGYWEAELIDTVNMDGAKWVFTFTYDGKSKTYTRGVPEEDSYNFAALPF